MISDLELARHVKANEEDEEELAELRRFRASAIAAIEAQTGWYWGPVTTLVDTLPATWPLILRAVPRATVEDPEEIVITVESRGASWEAVSADSYYADGRMLWLYSAWSTGLYRFGLPGRYRVTYTGGFDVDEQDPDIWAAPEDIKQYVRMTVGHFWLNREATIVGTTAYELPMGVRDGLAYYRL